MRLTKQSLVKATALGLALIGTMTLAAPASANSFRTDYGIKTTVSYDDKNNEFCVGTGVPSTPVHIYSKIGGQGPVFTLYAGDDTVECVSLKEALEGTPYYYQVEDQKRVAFYS